MILRGVGKPAGARALASPGCVGRWPAVRPGAARLLAGFALAWWLAFVLAPGSADAQQDRPEVPPEAVSAVARELNCPICQGYNLQDCPLEVCAQMRELIREQLAAGKSPDEIKASFVDEYGPQVLNAPPAEGVFLGAWVLPVIVLLVGAVVVGVVVWRGARRATDDGSDVGSRDEIPAGASESVYTRRFEQMLEEDDA